MTGTHDDTDDTDTAAERASRTEQTEQVTGRRRKVRPPAIPLHRADQEYDEVGGLAGVALAPMTGRTAGRLVDGVIVAVPGIAGVLWIGGMLPGWIRATVLLGVLAVLAIGYESVVTAILGTTPGKRLAGVRVVRLDSGMAPGAGASLVRCLVLFLPGAVPVLGQLYQVCCLGSVIADEQRHRGWHDRVAGTIVVVEI